MPPFFILFAPLFYGRFGGDSCSTGDPAGVGADCLHSLQAPQTHKTAMVDSSTSGTTPHRRIRSLCCRITAVHHITPMNFYSFSSLNFFDSCGARLARHTFANGWVISVAAGSKDSGIYGDIEHNTFEVGIIRPNGNMLEDVISWQTPEEITTIMGVIKML